MKIQKIIAVLLIIFVAGCKDSSEKNTKKSTKEAAIEEPKTTTPTKVPVTTDIEKTLVQQGLIKLKDLDPSIKIELKYSTTDNFMKADVYGDFDEGFLQKKPAQMLVKASKNLQAKYPNYRLLVYDATRPLSKQWVLWNTLKVKPGELKTDFVADPNIGSIHNYGCAVDLTVYDNEAKQPLDMGTIYDFFGELAYPKHEARMLREGKLTEQQVLHRKILTEAMTAAGFMPITSEWWHFNAVSRSKAKELYRIVK